MSKVISTTVVNPNGKEDTCAYAVVDSKELYYLLSLVTAPDKYTISFFIKSLANETLTLWYGEESKEFEVTTSWQKITWNFSAEWVDNVMLQFTEGEYYIYNTMLERGNVATDYSMSQYDQKKVLKDMENTLNTKYAQLSIALDDITLEVSETSSKLGNVESSVKLMSDEIGLKVNKNGIIGAINLSSEQAQIMASKIDLVGAVTLSSLSSDVASKFDTLDDITVTDNNITYIDGGKIYTGSITADKIDVDDLSALEATIGGWDIESGEINKSFPQQVTSAYGKNIKGSYSGNYLIFSTSNSQMTGLIDTHFNYWGTRFENSGGMGVEYGATGIRVAPSATALTNKEYKEVLAFSDDNVWAKKLSTEAIGCNGDAFIKNVNGETVKGGTVVTTSGADLDTVASQIPKLLTVRYSLPDITWTKSYGGLYYAYSELGSRGVNTVLAITAGNLGNIRTIDNIFFGIISGARIQICANTNSFMSGAYYEAQILYI